MSFEFYRPLSSASSSFSVLDSPNSTVYTGEDEINEMKLRISLLEIENQHIKNQKSITNMEKFKKEISGVWKICSGTNINEHLEKNKGTEMYDILFQTSDKNIQFNGDNDLTLSDNIGSKQYNIETVKLSKPGFTQKSDRVTFNVTFISDNCLKTITILENLEEIEEIQFVNNGQLFIIIKGFGIECCRIYSKVSNNDLTIENPLKMDEIQEKTSKELEEMKKMQNELMEMFNTLRFEHEQMKMENSIKIMELEAQVKESQSEKTQELVEDLMEELKFQKITKYNEINEYAQLADRFNGKWKYGTEIMEIEVDLNRILLNDGCINGSYYLNSEKDFEAVTTQSNRIYFKLKQSDGLFLNSVRYEIVEGKLIRRQYYSHSLSDYSESVYERE